MRLTCRSVEGAFQMSTDARMKTKGEKALSNKQSNESTVLQSNQLVYLSEIMLCNVAAEAGCILFR